jgi:hypothetical protein
MRARTFVVIVVIIAAASLLSLVTLSVFGTPSEPQEATVQTEQIASRPTPLPPPPLPSNYRYVEFYPGGIPDDIDLHLTDDVIPIEPAQLITWCNNCWWYFLGMDTGHVVAETFENECTSVTIRRNARSSAEEYKDEELLVHALLFTEYGKIVGAGAAEIQEVCAAVFWLSDDPIG